jgi:hypothetical protein
VAEPFVVIGDGDPATVQQWANQVVGWAVDRLKRQFFDRDPNRILNVWLFEGEASYRQHNLRLFGTEPTTPFGYYSSDEDALVMNIETGGGTLVHELVHPFVEANFPNCPAWFNEGLGSLFEQSAESEGQIVGLVNRRLAGLQQAIHRGRLPSFARLTATSSRAYYDEDPGTNYAQARYLLYYLQQHGLLERYYRQFVAAAKHDPTGYRTLKRVLGQDDMARFQRSWEAFVMQLAFP